MHYGPKIIHLLIKDPQFIEDELASSIAQLANFIGMVFSVMSAVKQFVM